MVMIILLIVLDVLAFLSMDNPGRMEKPEKKTGGRLLFFGILLITMGIGGFILKKTGMPQLKLNLNIESELRRLLLDLLLLTYRLLTEVTEFMTEYATALLTDGAILLVIGIIKKVIRVKQIKSWENHININWWWYIIQRFLVVLLPTLSACFLTNAFVKHLTGIENATKIILESGLWGISVTKDFVYRNSVSICTLNYFCTLGLMIYWQSICLIPKSSSGKILMSLILLPCVLLLNYVLVRTFYGAVAASLPPVMLAMGIFVVGCIVYLLTRLFDHSEDALDKPDGLSELIDVLDEAKKSEALRGIETCYRAGDLYGINSCAREAFSPEEREKLASYCRNHGFSSEACDAIRRN